MDRLLIGCQTYPWKMGKKYAGEVPHMLETASAAGFAGLEAEIDMLGPYFDRPGETAEIFRQKNMRLAALVLHQDWEGPCQNEAERELSEKAIAFLQYFPFAKLMMSHHAGSQPRGEGKVLWQRRKNLVSCMQEVAVSAAEAGIVSCFHPNSAKNSLFVSEEDYSIMFELLGPTAIGWAPDVGHIVNGGIDALRLMQTYRDRIRHVHFKDRGRDGAWSVMGEGSIDYPAVVRLLAQTGYRGWIMVEDESTMAADDSDAVVRMDGAYMLEVMKNIDRRGA